MVETATTEQNTEAPARFNVIRRVRAWDWAATEKADGCYTAKAKLYVTDKSDLIIAHVEWFQDRWSNVWETMIETAKADGPAVEIVVPEDGLQKALVDSVMMDEELSAFVILPISERGGSKLVRANLWIRRMEPPRHKIFILDDGTWDVAGFKMYLSRYTGHGDPPPIMDIVDAISLGNIAMLNDIFDEAEIVDGSESGDSDQTVAGKDKPGSKKLDKGGSGVVRKESHKQSGGRPRPSRRPISSWGRL